MANVTAIKSARSKITNAKYDGTNGAEGIGDRGANQYISQSSANPYNSNNYIAKWRAYVQAYETDWAARKIVRIPVEDALRKPWIVEGIDETLATQIGNFANRLNFEQALKRSLMLERLLGGCLTFMGIEGEDDELGESYNPKEGRQLQFVNAIPISRITRATWCHDPLSPHYMRPEMYLINGRDVHISRFLCFDGHPLFDPYDYALTNFRANLAGFGQSRLAPLWDDLLMATGTRQAAYQLIQVNNTIIAAVSDLQDLQGTKSGQQALAKVKDIANQMSMYRAAVIDGEKVDITQSSASFGSVPELMMSYLQVLSAASDIPATRFLGQAPGGLNANGESDLENYYNMIDAYQRQEIEPQLRRFYDVVGYYLAPTTWKEERNKLKFAWPPLWNEKESIVSTTKAQYLTNVMTALDAGLMGDMAAIEELNQKNIFGVKLDEIDRDLLDGADDMMSGEPVDAKNEIQSLRQGGAAPSNPIKVGNGFDPKEMAMGMKEEQEHKHLFTGDNIPDEEQIRAVVTDHLKEDPKYYTKLKKAGLVNTSYNTEAQVWKRIDDLDVIIKQLVKELHQVPADTRKPNEIDTRIMIDHKLQAAYKERDHLSLIELPRVIKLMNQAMHQPKQHLQLHGLDIMIETMKGELRQGVDADGNEWKVVMPADYGELISAYGADGDLVDCYIGPNLESQVAFVVDQVDANTGAFDEHKVILGTDSSKQAYDLYKKGFSDGRGADRWSNAKRMTIEELKIWLAGNTKVPVIPTQINVTPPAPQIINVSMPAPPQPIFNVTMPEQQGAIVNINNTVPDTIVNVEPAIVNVAAPNVTVDQPQVIVNVPETIVNVPAPIVNVEGTIVQVPSPIVNVAAPIINVEQPAQKEGKIKRDAAGNMTGIEYK